jgi:hypothetical protein
MFVGIAEVKLQPNSSLYALCEGNGQSSSLSFTNSLSRRARGRREEKAEQEEEMEGNALVVNIHQPLSVRVTEVRVVRGTIV